MKKYIKCSEDRKVWQSQLPEDVYLRLCACSSSKKDIVPLAKAYYTYSTRVQEEGLSKEDCLDYMLEWVLDWNGGTWDYTTAEYNKWLNAI